MALILLDGDTVIKDMSTDDLRQLELGINEAIDTGEDTEIALEGQTVEIIMNPGAMEDAT